MPFPHNSECYKLSNAISSESSARLKAPEELSVTTRACNYKTERFLPVPLAFRRIPLRAREAAGTLFRQSAI